jgi:aspartate aminotransferase
MSVSASRVAARIREDIPPTASTLPAAMASLRRQGRRVIDLAQGEVEDIPTPEHIKEGARRALHDNRTRYTATCGIPELREAIVRQFQRDMGLGLDPSQVVASTGAKQSVLNFMMAVLNPGDEVLVPSPYWASYLHQVRLAGGHPRVVPTAAKGDFKITADAIRRHRTGRTRVLVLNNPNNPSGAVYTRTELEGILEAALSASLLVLSDEVYHRLTYDRAEHTCFAALAPEAAGITVTVNALSKTYCMTGWRVGFAAGPRDLVEAMEQVQRHSTSCPNAIAQWAAVAALEGDQACVESLREQMEARRLMAISAFREMEVNATPTPRGGLYVFPSVPPLSGPVGSEVDFAAALLEETGVLVAPGRDFGVPDRIRVCFGASRGALVEGLSRFAGWIRTISDPSDLS